jgi:DNA polymerase I-like protein with 3'-5' exonuclease and polymerase domains
MKEREAFKNATHGYHYGLGPLKYIKILRLKGVNIEDIEIKGVTNPLAKAKFILDSYGHRCPAISRWKRETVEKVHKTRTLHNCFGRRRFFMGRISDIDRIALSYDPQSSVGNITNQAFLRLDNKGYDIVVNMHDGLVILCPDSKLEQCKNDVREAFHHPITLNGRTFSIPVDIKVGPSWGEVE